MVQFSSVAQSCLTLQPHGLQHARPPCPSPTPEVYSNSCPLSRWCHPTISSSVIPFGTAILENFQQFLIRLNTHFHVTQAFLVLAVYPREMKTYVHTTAQMLLPPSRVEYSLFTSVFPAPGIVACLTQYRDSINTL